MSYYNFKITNGEEEIVMLSAHEPFYDNVIYWQLAKLIDVVSQGVEDTRMLLSRVYSNTDYFNLSSIDDEPEVVIDLKTKTLTNPSTIYLYKNVEELSKDYPCDVTYREEAGRAYAKWEGDEEYEIKKVFFEDETLFTKKVLTFDELKLLDTFIGYLLDIGDSEFILPSGSIIRLNLA